MLLNVLLVGAGGFIGSSARYGASVLLRRFDAFGLPLATLSVNVSGCFLMGALWAHLERQSNPSSWVLFLATGVLGGFTTFSAFGLETVTLLQDRSFLLATLNVALSLVLGLGATVLGRAIG